MSRKFNFEVIDDDLLTSTVTAPQQPEATFCNCVQVCEKPLVVARHDKQIKRALFLAKPGITRDVTDGERGRSCLSWLSSLSCL